MQEEPQKDPQPENGEKSDAALDQTSLVKIPEEIAAANPVESEPEEHPGRAINTHELNEANSMLRIRAVDEPGDGGASHRYVISGMDWGSNRSVSEDDEQLITSVDDNDDCCLIVFQNGPIPAYGVNGVTQEALLAIVADRLESFQKGPYPNEHNHLALQCVLRALTHLKARTLERINRGVEGTHTA